MAGLPYALTGGATRPDAISGLNPVFSQAMTQLYMAAPPDVQRELALTSAYRSAAVQQALWDKSDKTGHTVAAPGKSRHQHGTAADLAGFGVGNGNVSDTTREWVHANAGNFGLGFPMSYEPWHIQLLGEGGSAGASQPGIAATMASAVDPRMAAMAQMESNPWKNFTDDVAQRRGGSVVGERSAGSPLSVPAGSDPGIPPLETAAATVQPNEIKQPTSPQMPSQQISQLADLFKVRDVGTAAHRVSRERPGGQAKPLTRRG